MERREILRYTAFATGAALSAPLIATICSGCKTEGAGVAQNALGFFNKEEFGMVKHLVDVILPKTDSPSASEVGVHTMIDHMVSIAYDDESQKKYSKGFQALTSYLQDKSGDVEFAKLDDADQLKILQELELSNDAIISDAKKGMVSLKQQAIAYYLSSEEIGTKYLNYLPVPGAYEGCISLADAGNKAWAL